jgi:SOS-response transcriptional repressor LexA
MRVAFNALMFKITEKEIMENFYMEIGKAVKLVRNKRKLSQTTLAAKMKDYYDSTNMSRFERGEQGISQDKLSNIAEILGVSVSTLYAIAESDGKILEEHEDALLSNKEIITFDRSYLEHNNTNKLIKNQVPLISSVQAGMWSEIKDSVLSSVDTEWVPTTCNVGKYAFATTVKGDSMTNPHGKKSLPEGSIVVVDPDTVPSTGSIVIVRRASENDATIKQLMYDGDIKYLKPLNPQYPVLTLDENCVLVGTVKEMTMRFE